MQNITVEKRGLTSWIESEELSDNSAVYNVMLKTDDHIVKFDCPDFDHAKALFDQIEMSVNIGIITKI